jgi:hypothetical protein
LRKKLGLDASGAEALEELKGLRKLREHVEKILPAVKVNRSRTGCGVPDEHARFESAASKKQL